MIKKEPNYFKKTKFKGKPPEDITIINLKNLEEIANKLKSKKKTRNDRISVDLNKMGYDKLLGTGKVATPISVKVSQFSETAQRKIELAGGEIITKKP